jgi:hypothetical protein
MHVGKRLITYVALSAGSFVMCAIVLRVYAIAISPPASQSAQPQQKHMTGIERFRSSSIQVCGDIRTETVPEDLLRETPLRTRRGLERFQKQHQAQFLATRRAINPAVIAAARDAAICAGGGRDLESIGRNLKGMVGEIQWDLESTPTHAKVSRIKVRSLRGSKAQTQAANPCLEAHLLNKTFEADAPAGQEFVPYSGRYPNVFHWPTDVVSGLWAALGP